MSHRSSSPSLSSDNDSELSFSLDEDVPEISDREFIPYDGSDPGPRLRTKFRA